MKWYLRVAAEERRREYIVKASYAGMPVSFRFNDYTVIL
jgi:hypothetical protein